MNRKKKLSSILVKRKFFLYAQAVWEYIQACVWVGSVGVCTGVCVRVGSVGVRTGSVWSMCGSTVQAYTAFNQLKASIPPLSKAR